MSVRDRFRRDPEFEFDRAGETLFRDNDSLDLGLLGRSCVNIHCRELVEGEVCSSILMQEDGRDKQSEGDTWRSLSQESLLLDAEKKLSGIEMMFCSMVENTVAILG